MEYVPICMDGYIYIHFANDDETCQPNCFMACCGQNEKFEAIEDRCQTKVG